MEPNSSVPKKSAGRRCSSRRRHGCRLLATVDTPTSTAGLGGLRRRSTEYADTLGEGARTLATTRWRAIEGDLGCGRASMA